MDLQGLSSRSVIGMYYAALEATQGIDWVKAASMLMPSNQDAETYKFLGFTPPMREWIGGKHPKGLRENGISITNLEFESTLEIATKDLRRDKTGQIMVRIGEQVDRANEHWADLLTTLIESGESTACYDGQYFFDTDHSEGDSGTLSNDLSASNYSELNVATATNPTAYELSNVILKMIQHMYSLKDDQGKPMNRGAKKFHVLVPVAFLGAAWQAIYNDLLNTGSGTINNPLARIGQNKGWEIQVSAEPSLTWTTKLAVFRTDGRVKSLIRQAESLDGSMPAGELQENFGVKLTYRAEGSDDEFYNKKHVYSIEANRNVGFGYWQYAILATLS